ncbi:MAG: prenyltransferase/squalene oxidase repeat-containing protein [Candidatus Thermoplasmatota archaeon]
MLTEQKKKKLISFIYSREQEVGGFSSSHTAPPTVEDTYFALQLLAEFNEISVSKQTISYISQLNHLELRSPKQIYQVATIYRLTHQIDLFNDLYSKIMEDAVMLNTLSDVYYMVLIKELYQIKPARLTTKEHDLLVSVQMKNEKALVDYQQLIFLMKKFGLSFPSQEYITVIQNSQNPDGGFGIVPYSTSYLEPTYYALTCLKELHAPLLHVSRCERFVDSCITRIGGFGRQMITLPTPEYSFYAVMSLKLIEQIKKYAKPSAQCNST